MSFYRSQSLYDSIGRNYNSHVFCMCVSFVCVSLLYVCLICMCVMPIVIESPEKRSASAHTPIELHGTHMNESWHTYEWVMAHIWMSHGTHMNESWHTYESEKCSEPVHISAGIFSQRFTRGDHFDILENFSVFCFSTFSIFLSRTLFWNDPRTTQLRRGYAGRGWLTSDSGLFCPWQKGGGETSAIGREALRVVDYVDSSMWYVPLWILESSALS